MKLSSLALFCCFFIAAPPHVTYAQPEKDPIRLFEEFWKTYDRNYALFDVKHIDWNALYRVYRPRITSHTSDEELFTVMSDMLGNLNDNHIRLTSPDRRFQSGILGRMTMEDFSLDLIKSKYLKGKVETRLGELFQFGWLDDSIGYFHFNGFGRPQETSAVIDEIIRTFRSARGIIVDVRANGGGDDRVGKLIADRFAGRKRLYMTTRSRNGPHHDAFTPPKYWYVEPEGPIQFTGPVIVLTHRFSVSAAENFALAMRVLPNVTSVGDATSGVFADVYGDQLSNGWRFTVPYKIFYDQAGFCWEGIGVPSDIREVNTKEDIQGGRDRVLELAIQLISIGHPVSHPATAGLQDVRESLARPLSRNIDEHGIDAALAAYEKTRSGDPSGYYLDEEELREVGKQLLDSKRVKEAVSVFKLEVREFPGMWIAHESLGDAYDQMGDAEQARACYRKSLELNPRSYPWERTAFESDTRLVKGIKILSRILVRTLDDKDIDAALEAFEKGKAGGAGSYFVDENEINQLGYRLVNAGKVPEAIKIFALNVREFPKSWNVYDSLGEAYAAHGDKELAIKNYEKSIELNPRNTNGAIILKRLKSQ